MPEVEIPDRANSNYDRLVTLVYLAIIAANVWVAYQQSASFAEEVGGWKRAIAKAERRARMEAWKRLARSRWRRFVAPFHVEREFAQSVETMHAEAEHVVAEVE